MTEEGVLFVRGVIWDLVEDASLEADENEAVEALRACWLGSGLEGGCAANAGAVGDCKRDIGAECIKGEAEEAKFPLELTELRPLLLGVLDSWLFNEDVSPSASSFPSPELVLSFPPTTAPLNRLYNPLIPFCINSSAKPFDSTLAEAEGGEENSLNVVSVSECEAELWILSRACERCSLSAWDNVEIEARDPRRDFNLEEGLPSIAIPPTDDIMTDDVEIRSKSVPSMLEALSG